MTPEDELMELSIIRYPHPTLRFKSKPLRRVDTELREIAARMLELMYEAEGVGLAANQVDLPLRMFVANPSGKQGEGEELVLINPELQTPKGTEMAQEGCLSLPGLYGNVKRPKSIRVQCLRLARQRRRTRSRRLFGACAAARKRSSGRRDVYRPTDRRVVPGSRRCTGRIGNRFSIETISRFDRQYDTLDCGLVNVGWKDTPDPMASTTISATIDPDGHRAVCGAVFRCIADRGSRHRPGGHQASASGEQPQRTATIPRPHLGGRESAGDFRSAQHQRADGDQQIREVGGDLLVVCDYGQILKPDALAVAPRGGINLHGSLLPAYRGAAPVQRALLSGDRMTGVTVIHMTPKLDGGPILASAKRKSISTRRPANWKHVSPSSGSRPCCRRSNY